MLFVCCFYEMTRSMDEGSQLPKTRKSLVKIKLIIGIIELKSCSLLNLNYKYFNREKEVGEKFGRGKFSQ